MANIKSFSLIFALLAGVSAFAQQSEENRGYVAKVGDMAPDFTIQYLDGTTKQLSDLRGKVIMLQFTASWCSVCRKEMPHIEADIWQKHKGNPNFVLLGVDLKEDAEVTRAFAEKMKITYPLVLDLDGKKFELFAEKNAGVTRNVIIDPSGRITFLTRLYDEKEFGEMKQHIEGLLKGM